MNLATVEKIISISPINGAEKIELAQVLGYSVIVEKGRFKVDDLCVWHNPDTVVDSTNPAYQMLAKYKYRLKVIKMLGTVSQGLALPLDILSIPEEMRQEGTDVTQVVKLTKYEKTDPFFHAKFDGLKAWPGFLRKTDEPNLRTHPKVIAELQEQEECFITLKMDGTSVTVFHKDGKFGICSRNFELDLDAPSLPHSSEMKRMLEKYDLESRLKKLGKNLAIQGELCGPKINAKKKNIVKDIAWTAFSVWNIDTQRYVGYSDMIDVINQLNAIEGSSDKPVEAIPTVPLLRRCSLKDTSLQDLIQLANGVEYAPGVPGEGIVIRPVKETQSQRLRGRLSVKVISEKYCLLHGE
uniref:RNA ligase n=1 Tax=Clandestinovirus TaxID=2831644 RepID=A0A8F8PQR1_9VIRU|nr:RNA ligase [Clandestinovirus]